MTQVVRPFRGVPADQRRAERRAKLIDAGFDVIARDGLAGVKVSAVCKQANLTERYFYESFANRDELLVAAFLEIAGGLYQEATSALEVAPADLLARCHAVAEVVMNPLLDDPRKARAYVEAIGSEALQAGRKAFLRGLAELLAEHIIELYELDPSRHGRLLEVPTLVLMSGIGEAVSYWLDGTIDITRDELVDQAAQMAVGIAEQVASVEVRR